MPCWRLSSSACLLRGLLADLSQEAINHARLPGLVSQGLADDPARELDGKTAYLGAQRGQRLLPVGLDLSVGRGDDPLPLGRACRAAFGDDLSRLFLGALAQSGCLVPGVGKLCPVLLEHLLRLCLRVVCTLQAAFDLVSALGEGRADPWH